MSIETAWRVCILEPMSLGAEPDLHFTLTWTSMATVKMTSECTEMGCGLSFDRWMAGEPQRSGGPCPKTYRFQETTTGTGRRTKRCTEMACGLSCVHPMEAEWQ